jgi:potassium-transporting ATPase KdpC subunit
MLAILRPAASLLVLFGVLTGVAYPLAVTAGAQLLFPDQANGSLLERDGRVVGSRLIGQPFDEARYFWGRPSATAPTPYQASASSGSNLGPTNPALLARVRERVAALRAAHPDRAAQPVPVDLVTASGSGLDPHISPAAALYQVHRVAAARQLTKERVRQLVLDHVEGRTLGILGEPRVNVLLLNVALEDLASGGS